MLRLIKFSIFGILLISLFSCDPEPIPDHSKGEQLGTQIQADGEEGTDIDDSKT